MNGKPLDLLGRRFDRLLVIGQLESGRRGNTMWLCRCDCGTERRVLGFSLNNGKTRSCGCLRIDNLKAAKTTHGMSLEPIYFAWRVMVKRCTDPKAQHWDRYGGRGIKVCERWLTFDNFYADMGPRPEGMTIERQDNNGDYEPGNCVWATRAEQSNNRECCTYVEVDGARMTLTAAARLRGVPLSTARYRISTGRPPFDSLNTSTTWSKKHG